MSGGHRASTGLCRPGRLAGALLSCLLACAAASAAGAEPELSLGGSLRAYLIQSLEAPEPGQDRTFFLGQGRLTCDVRFTPAWRLEFHGIADYEDPPSGAAARTVGGVAAGRQVDLSWSIRERPENRLFADVDRLNLRYDGGRIRLVLGRQPIAWGVVHFWPALDRLAPFPPERVDRDYRPGVDAARLTVGLGRFSELDLIGASLGRQSHTDGALGALVRWDTGAADFGVAGGTFRRETLLGLFVESQVRGTGLRGEASYTRIDDPLDEARVGKGFFRASAGCERQLTEKLVLVAEAAYDGFAEREPEHYPEVAASARYQRGEALSLGDLQAALGLTWQAHPLVTLGGTALCNVRDPSVLFIPTLSWSFLEDAEFLLGALIGIGPGPGAGPPALLRSEYGATPKIAYAGVKVYF